MVQVVEKCDTGIGVNVGKEVMFNLLNIHR